MPPIRAGAHQREQRLGRLAGAAADCVAVLQPELTTAGRWAVTVAIADTSSELVALVDGAAPLRHLAAETALQHLHRRIGHIQRLAAAHPPTGASQAILDRPIPVTVPLESRTPTTQLLANAAAGIVHHTRPGQPLALCELLAVTIALESLSETTARLLATLDPQAPDRRAANAWRAVQNQFRPFNDGTRRRQTETPPLVGCALDLHRALSRTGAPPTVDELVAVRDALRYVPAVGRNLLTAVRQWADTNALLGYACDMSTGPGHVTAYLAGHRPEGLIPAELPELRPTMMLIADATTVTHRLASNLTNAFGAVRSYAHMSRSRDPLWLDQQAEVAGSLAPSRPLWGCVSRRDDNHHANAEALEFWASGANGHAAISYLRRRGINVASLPEPYRVGYARPGWTSLVDHLPPAQRAAAQAAGLILQTQDGRLIDRFRDRVMFPIREPDGRIAGFIGRNLSPDPTAPKYLNTPGSDTFSKSSLFYGLHEADRAGGFRPVLVEGPLDALAIAATAHRTGNRDLLPMATCGTALTREHATQIAAWCQQHRADPVIAYDADRPGRAAAIRAGELLRDHGVNPYVTTLSAGLDPTEHLATKADVTPYRTRPAGTAIPLAAAVTELIITEHHGRSNPDWPETKLRIAHQISRHLTGYSDPLLPEAAGAACNIAARRAGIHPDTLLHAITARRPRIDVDVPDGAPVIGGRAL